MSFISAGGAVTGAGEVQYQIERSLRFNDAESTYLTRTPSGAGTSIRKSTVAFWYKRGKILATNSAVITVGVFSSSNKISGIGISDDARVFSQGGVYGISTDYNSRTLAQLRDPSAWYHIVVATDTTQATEANRLKIYINGVDQDLVGLGGNAAYEYPSLNFDTAFNAGVVHSIGITNTFLDEGLDGLLAEFYMVDGQQLDPTSFGEFNTDTGVWEPKRYVGEYGTNGWFLNFSDNSGVTSTTLGKDQVGSNNWTPNNFAVTAGAGNDSLVDTCTLFGTDTGIGGEVRGNYCTLNPLDKGSAITLTNGNLDFGSASNPNNNCRGTFGMSSGKFYFEFVITSAIGGSPAFGIGGDTASLTSNFSGDLYLYINNGTKAVNGVETAYGATFTQNDVIGVAFDADNNSITFFKNNSSQGAITGVTSGLTWRPFVHASTTATITANFGQRAFEYTAPEGFKSLCSTSLPEPAIRNGGEYFNTVLYTGNSAANTITTVGFQPDLLWIKSRVQTYNHYLWDTIRGAGTAHLSSNNTNVEGADPTTLSSFNANGFSIPNGSGINDVSSGTNGYVAWNWRANGAGVSNTAGTISSTVSANTDSGFSIVTWTGTSNNASTIGHGLGVAPKLIITKGRTNPTSWVAGIGGITGFGVNDYLVINSTNAKATSSTFYQAYGSSTFTVGVSSADEMNKTGNNYVSYCFAEIPGYSAFGSYTGNGSNDGSFIFTNFHPAFVMIKSSSNTHNWIIFDSARGSFNVNGSYLYANISSAEGTSSTIGLDFLSNGFKNRNDYADANNSGKTYIYMAFASNPFKFALAR